MKMIVIFNDNWFINYNTGDTRLKKTHETTVDLESRAFRFLPASAAFCKSTDAALIQSSYETRF